VGNVSALAGLRDDSRYLQISAPVQPGNSGGPLLDASGHLIGIVTAKLDAIRYARITGDIPQNVNFALKAEVARTFLDSKGISYRIERSELQLAPGDVGDNASPFTVYLKCKQDLSRSAAATPAASNPPPPSRINPTPQQISLCLKGNLSPDLRINGCTAMIQSGRLTGRDLSTVFYNRGLAYSAKADYHRAMADWTKALELANNAYSMLWRYLERRRAGESGDAELASSSLRLKTKDWPYPVAEFYLGKRSEGEMLAAATYPDEQCEAQFYLGEWHLLRNDLAAATMALRTAATSCPKNLYEYLGAVAELNEIGASFGQ
jgi:hypothetical protein